MTRRTNTIALAAAGYDHTASEIDSLRAALMRFWKWQKTVQQLLPAGLADQVKDLLGLPPAQEERATNGH